MSILVELIIHVQYVHNTRLYIRSTSYFALPQDSLVAMDFANYVIKHFHNHTNYALRE